MSLNEPLNPSLEAGDTYSQLTDKRDSSATYSSTSSPSPNLLRNYRIVIALLSVAFLTAAILAVIFASKAPNDTPMAPPETSSTGGSMTGPPVLPTSTPMSPTSDPPIMPTTIPSSTPSPPMTSTPIPMTSTPIPPPQVSSAGPAPYIPVETATLRELGRDMDFSRDLTADPCNDWYQYSCGGWVQSTPQGNFTSITKGFTLARLENQRYIADIIFADWPIITPFFQSCMNNELIQAVGTQPLQPLLDLFSPTLSPITAKSDVFFQLGKLRTSMRLNALIVASQTSNQSAPTQPLLNLGFGGYTATQMASYRGDNKTRLIAGVTAVFTAIGDAPDDAMAWASAAINFEAQLMNITARGQNRGPMTVDEEYAEEKRLAAVNGMYTFDEVQALAPTLPLMNWLTATSIPEILRSARPPVDGLAFIADPDAFPMVESLIANTNVTTLLAYARWRVLNISMPYLAWNVRSIHHEYFADDDLALALPNDYTYCSGLVVNSLDDLFGRYFVSLRLQPEKAQVARNLITWIRQAFERNLPSVSWMDDATRAVALDKANAVLELVGGPENGNWGDYSQVTIKRDTWWQNWFQVQGMRARDEWLQLTKPISRGRFSMNPSLVNAQYSSRQNAMTFPAAILQDPFFNFDYPMSVNLGRIGMVMGHELLHGFDNNGRQFDKDGVRRQWWDDSVIWAFGNKTQCLIDQYNNMTIQGTQVNGRNTLGENIADNGGLHMAYLALQWYKDMLAQNNTYDPVPTNTVAPLNSDQLFYWANAQTWCTKATDAAIANQVRTDVHAPGQARVAGPVVNQDGFAKAFNCPVGSAMNPAKKCDLY